MFLTVFDTFIFCELLSVFKCQDFIDFGTAAWADKSENAEKAHVASCFVHIVGIPIAGWFMRKNPIKIP